MSFWKAMERIMKTCNKCKVKIKDDTKLCPLCQEPLDNLDTLSSKGIYPSFKINEHKYHLISKLVIILSVVFSSISAMITNYLTYNGVDRMVKSFQSQRSSIHGYWSSTLSQMKRMSQKKILEYTMFSLPY